MHQDCSAAAAVAEEVTDRNWRDRLAGADYLIVDTREENHDELPQKTIDRME